MNKHSKSLIAALLAGSLAAVPLGAHAATARAATGTGLPPLNRQALAAAIAGLPDAQQAAAIVQVAGEYGRWSGTSGMADLATAEPARSGDEFRIGSISKTFIATVVLQLAAQQRIDLSRPVQEYLPGLLRADDPPISVTELLNHTSGLGPVDGVVNTGDPAWFLAHRLDSFSTSQLLGQVLQQPLIFAPGTHQQYNGVNYIVLAMLIEKVTGHTYAQEIQQRILRPLGLRHTYVPFTDPAIPGRHLHGYYLATQQVDITLQNPSLYGAQGAMISDTADLDRFMTALLAGRLLPQAELSDMLTIPAVATGPYRYGMGLLSVTLPNGITLWGHTGETPGYVTGMFATRDLARTLVFSFTPIGPDSSTIQPTELRIAEAAYDPPAANG